MSKMLVAYRKCGCRAAALLVRGKLEDVDFQAELGYLEGCEIREEEHERIGVLRCAEHQAAYEAKA